MQRARGLGDIAENDIPGPFPHSLVRVARDGAGHANVQVGGLAWAGAAGAAAPVKAADRAEAGPAVRTTRAAAAVIARRTAGALSVLRAMVGVPPADS